MGLNLKSCYIGDSIRKQLNSSLGSFLSHYSSLFILTSDLQESSRLFFFLSSLGARLFFFFTQAFVSTPEAEN